MSDTQTSVSTANFDDIILEFETSDDQKADQQDNSFTKPQTTSFDDIVGKPAPKEPVTATATATKEEDDKGEEGKDNVFDTPLEKLKEKATDVPQTSILHEALEELVKEGELFLFSDKEKLSDYSKEELIDLIKENKKHAVESGLDGEIKDFFESLPKDLQYAIQYATNGGADMRSLYKALASSEEIRSLSLDNKKDQEAIISEYYSALDWTPEEISEELKRLSDLGEEAYKKQAEKFKPKLDKMHEQVVQNKIAQQEAAKLAQQKEVEKYIENATETIKKGVLGEVKLDKKIQSALYSGLANPSYTSRKGLPTNELGHLIEKYQFVEPNFEKIYKALWLLKDEAGFFEAYNNIAVSKNNTATVRTLKTEQGKKDATGVIQDDSETSRTQKSKTINRPVNFMAGLNK